MSVSRPNPEAPFSSETQLAHPNRRVRNRVNTPIDQARKLENVRYDIRGRILDKTEELEDQGHTILRLNVGNPAPPFGFEAPDEIMMAMIRNLPTAQGYCDSRGLYSARTAVVQYYQTRGITDVTVDEIYLGNGVSELITLTMQALCNPEDEILIPAPDYPLWTASVSLAGGTPVHYLTDESQGWAPDFDDLEARITPRTRGIVVINPNNPTGAVYSTEVLQRFVDLARKHDLMLFADEIYEKIVYDGRSMTNLATMTGRDVLCLTYSGLSKATACADSEPDGWPSPDHSSGRRASSKASNCWPTCECVPTCRRSTLSRLHSADASPSRTCCFHKVG